MKTAPDGKRAAPAVAFWRLLGDYERILGESDRRDPSGRLTQSQLISDTGRVYLFLAHVSGRLN